ncbi:MAG: glycosyltransferase involved in cell wall biosynthesis [Saprospiraceae bacterium]|jgi:glycosyltransferase involved in cell wall biosynthesis
MLVSVIIPVYNAEKYIAECLESVLQQTWDQLEIIVVDNNSADNSLEILKKYVAAYPTKIQLIIEQKQGAPAARNAGFRAAKSSWLQFLDVDDLLLPQKIENQLQFANPNVPFVVGTPIYEDLSANQTISPSHPDPFKGLFHGLQLGNTSANLWNRNFLNKINGWDEQLPDTQDIDLMFRLLKKSENVVYDEQPNTIHRDRPDGQVSTHDPVGHRQRHVRLRHEMMEYLKAEKPDYYAKSHQFYEQMMFWHIKMLTNEDFESGADYFEKYLLKGWCPHLSKEVPMPLWNIIAMRFLGFRRTESWKTTLRKYHN